MFLAFIQVFPPHLPDPPFCVVASCTRDHVLSRLEHVWGPGDGRPVEELKVSIDQVSKMM